MIEDKIISYHTPRRYLMIASLCLIVLASIHCKRSDRAGPGESSVTIGYNGDERIFLQEYWDMGAEYLMFLPLTDQDEKADQPVLAERWEHSEDYREWTYFLRKDVRWHDGVPVTAHDIKFTMDLRQHPAFIKGGPDRYSFEIFDDFTFKVTLKKPTEGFHSYYVFYPRHLLEELDPKEFYSWDFWTHPVGNGPYRYVRHMPKTMVEVEANPDYYRGKPRIERVILKFLPQMSLVELLSGNVDALWGVDRNTLLMLLGDDRFRSYHSWGYHFYAIYWNHRHLLFQSPKIRKALTMAINRRELAGVLNYPEGVPILDAITTSRQFRQGLYPEPLPYNPERARKMLEEEGWRDIDGDGVRERDEEEFRFTAIADAEQEKIAIYVQDQLRRIGVLMEIQSLNTGTIRQHVKSGDFDALIFYIQNSTNQPNFGHVRMYGEDSPFGYVNSEMIRLLNIAKDTIDIDKLDRIYQEIMPIFAEDMPITLLLPSVFTSVVHRRIKGLSSPFRTDPVMHMEHLWIEEEKE
jgi:peptide/nickel transport system substrate-binding protein